MLSTATSTRRARSTCAGSWMEVRGSRMSGCLMLTARRMSAETNITHCESDCPGPIHASRATKVLTLYGILLCALLVLGLTTCNRQDTQNSGVASDDSLVTLAAMVSQKVVNIEALGADGAEARMGSGFFVSENGSVATCAHLVDGAKTIRVKTLSGAEFTFKKLVSLDKEKDLAILSVATDGVSFFAKSGVEVSVGTRIAVLGNPLGLKGTLTDGVVSAIRGAAEETRFLQISAPISPGSSGSPVVSLAGDLVGMVGARAEGGEGIGFALASKEIWESLSQAEANKNR